MRKNLVPPLNGITHSLHIKFGHPDKITHLWTLLIVLRWISPQLNTLYFTRYRKPNSILKFIYEDASAKDEKTFWSHKLKGSQNGKLYIHRATGIEKLSFHKRR